MLGSRVHEDLLAEGEDGDSQGENSGCQVDNILGLILVINLLPGLGGNAHLVNAGSGPVSQGLPSGLVLHQPAGSQERASSDHLLVIRLKTLVEVNQAIL